MMTGALLLAACGHDVPTTPKTEAAPLDGLSLLIWRDTSVSGNTTPAVDANMVYTLDRTHVVAAIAKTDRHTIWKTKLPTIPGDPNGYGLTFSPGTCW